MNIYLDAVHEIKASVPRSPSLIVALCGADFDGGCAMCRAGDKPTALTIENARIWEGAVAPAGSLS